jgi:hypothetical protein
MLSARSPKNIKISTFEKAWKSSHFRPDNQRQISLDLSRTCRYQKRLISLVSFANFFEIMWSAQCEYSKSISSVLFLLFWWGVLLYSKRNVEIIEERCCSIQRGVQISSFFRDIQRLNRLRDSCCSYSITRCWCRFNLIIWCNIEIFLDIFKNLKFALFFIVFRRLHKWAMFVFFLRSLCKTRIKIRETHYEFFLY